MPPVQAVLTPCGHISKSPIWPSETEGRRASNGFLIPFIHSDSVRKVSLRYLEIASYPRRQTSQRRRPVPADAPSSGEAEDKERARMGAFETCSQGPDLVR